MGYLAFHLSMQPLSWRTTSSFLPAAPPLPHCSQDTNVIYPPSGSVPYSKTQLIYEISINFHGIKLIIPRNQATRVGYTLVLCSSELYILYFGGARSEACAVTSLKIALSATRALLIRSCPSSAVITSLLAIYKRGVSRLRF